MRDLPQAGFVPKYGTKLTALGRLGRVASSGEEAAVATLNAELGFLASSFCLETLSAGRIWGHTHTEEWGFPNCARASWRFQPNKKLHGKGKNYRR